MKILFSPSEAKSLVQDSNPINNNSFCFTNLFEKRLEVLNKFTTFIKASQMEDLQKLFGIKDEEECENIKNIDLFQSSTCKAILRYTGVAFKYLDFSTLNETQKLWIYKNVIIFSNLFGPICAKDEIPMYKFKQGSKIENFKPESFYKKYFSSALDDNIGDDVVIDLRAGFYEKFYKLNVPYITMKFIKNDKVVSHWAKAYRGIVLRELSQAQPSSIEEFENIKFSNLSIKEIIQSKLKREYIFEIIS